MGKQIKGIPVREKIEKDIDKDIFLLAKNKIVPKIATIRVGADSGQIFYEKAIMKRAAAYKMKSENLVFEEGILQDELESKIIELNEDSSVHGILVLMPLPKYLDQDRISNLIKPDKDIDAITDVSYANLISGKDKDKAFLRVLRKRVWKFLSWVAMRSGGRKLRFLEEA